MVLEKTLESPLDCKEVQPVHPKGDQSWVSFGRTDALMLKLKLQYFGHLMRRTDSLEKTLMLGKTKYWSFSFSISPSNEYSGLISFRTDWLDLLAVQGSLKSLLQLQH